MSARSQGKRFIVGLYNKVTIRPEFFGTVPNFKGLSRKNTRSFGTLNCPEFRTLSRICPDLAKKAKKRIAVSGIQSHSSPCVAVDQNAVDYFDVFACKLCK